MNRLNHSKSSLLIFAITVSVICPALYANKPSTSDWAAMKEYWRHAPKYGCLACSVYIPAPKAATVPRNIGSLPVLQARLYDNKPKLACFCTNQQYIWVADDSSVYKIDARKGKLLRTFTVSDGLPDAPVRQLLLDDDTLWIVCQNRIARLKIATGKIEIPHQPAFSIARMAAGPSGTILITEDGAFLWNNSSKKFVPIGKYPAQQQIYRAIKKGFWEVQWKKHYSNLLRGVIAHQRNIFVLAGNTLSTFSKSSQGDSSGSIAHWKVIAKDVWRILADDHDLWAITTAGVLRFRTTNGKIERFIAGKGPAIGRPIDLIITDSAVYLLSEPRFDTRRKRYIGGGISIFDKHTGKWTTINRIGQIDVSFPTAATVHNGEVFIAVQLAGKVEHRSLHPGMASVRRFLPKITGLAIVIRGNSGNWQAIRLKGLKGEFRWVMGQGSSHRWDRVRPQEISQLLINDNRLWAVMKNFPENYYAGYYPSVQCIARKESGKWIPIIDKQRTNSLGLAGEQPRLMFLSATHGSPIVLAHGQRNILGLINAGRKLWVIHEGGAYVYQPSKETFQPALTEGFRIYWQATAAACSQSAIWFGSDAGTITRFDRNNRQFKLIGVVPNRKITRISIDKKGKVWVKTAPAKVVLPVPLTNLKKLPAGDVICYDGRKWTIVSAKNMPAQPTLQYRFRRGNYLVGPERTSSRKVRTLGFLKGVFKPKVLCLETPGRLWIKVWGGVGYIPLSETKGK